MLQNLKKKTEGFTIIEVLIVLVIAGLIMLIVFLAVPALQRNSRNTQRKDDAARILAALGEYKNNNPDSPWPASANDIVDRTGDLGFYQASDIFVFTATTAPPEGQTVKSILGFVNKPVGVYNKASCNPDDSNDVNSGVKQVVIFKVEAGGTESGQCIES